MRMPQTPYRFFAAILLVAAMAGGGAAAPPSVAALIAAERPAGGWGFAHPPGRRAEPYTWLVKAAEHLAAPLGLATWDLVAIRSPGTPAGGLLLLEDGSPAAVEAARRAGDLLVATQLEMGGWPSELPAYGRTLPEWFRLLAIRPAIDDDVTPGGVRLLLALWARTGDARYREAAERSIDLLLHEQDVSGGWPLVGHPAWARALRPRSSVRLALNDGATPFTIVTLLDAAVRLDRPELRAAAVRGADWLVAVRGDAPAWAQQYEADGTPAGARRFEPPAFATWETRHAVDALLAVARATGDARYCAPARSAVRWLERVQIAPGCWARFHDLETGEPVYVDARGTRVPDPYAARPGYSWIGEYGIPALLARVGWAAPPAVGAPLPGDPGACAGRPPLNGGFSGARGLMAHLARRRAVEPADLGPCAAAFARPRDRPTAARAATRTPRATPPSPAGSSPAPPLAAPASALRRLPCTACPPPRDPSPRPAPSSISERAPS